MGMRAMARTVLQGAWSACLEVLFRQPHFACMVGLHDGIAVDYMQCSIACLMALEFILFVTGCHYHAVCSLCCAPGSTFCLPTPTRQPFYHTPEEEIARGPACWLWDYLRRWVYGRWPRTFRHKVTR